MLFRSEDGVGRADFNTGTAFAGSVSLHASSQGLELTDQDIRDLLLPLYNANSTSLDVYTVMFRGDFNVSINGKLWLKDWCSYHGSFLILPQNYVFKYSVVGDPSTVSAASGAARGCARRPTETLVRTAWRWDTPCSWCRL